MKIDPYCQQRNCSPLNVLFSDVQIALISQVVPQLGGVKQRWSGKNKSSYTHGFLVYFCSVFPSVLWYCWLGLLTCKTVSQITYTVLVETLDIAQSIDQSLTKIHPLYPVCISRYMHVIRDAPIRQWPIIGLPIIGA